MWFGDEGIGGGRHGYLGSEKAVPAQEVPGLGRPQDQGSGELARQRPGLATARNCDGTHHISRGAYRVLAGPAALTSSCVLPFLPFLLWQIRLEHLRRLFREEREKLADPDSRRAKAEVEALLKRDAP